MIAITVLTILAISFHTYTFARYNFKKGSRKAGVGVLLFIAVSAGFAMYVMLR